MQTICTLIDVASTLKPSEIGELAMIGYVQMYINKYRKVKYRCSECRKDVNETAIKCPYCGILLIGDGD